MFLPIFVCLILNLQIGVGQVARKCKCPDIQTLPNFDINRFADGIWLKNQNSFVDPEFTLRCTSFMLTLQDGTIDEKLAGIDWNTGKVVSFPRQYVIKPEERKFRVFSLKGATPEDFVIPDTDYTNYAVVYSCRKGGNGLISEKVYIFSRKPRKLPERFLRRIKRNLKSHGVDTTNFLTIDHSHCPPYEIILSAQPGSMIIVQ